VSGHGFSHAERTKRGKRASAPEASSKAFGESEQQETVMKKSIMIACTLLALSGLAAAQSNGQATVVSGYATTGVYSLPVMPLVSTPSMTLEPTPLRLGVTNTPADNATTISSEGFDLGAAMSQDSYGAAELKSWSHPRKAAKIYTNQDVTQVNDTNGLVKFGNKTEHL
jgi:hypothetical protein